MCISYAVRQRHRKPVTDCYSMDSFACGFETRGFAPHGSCATHHASFCGALHIDKSFQSASPYGLASWTFVVTQSRHDGEFHLMELRNRLRRFAHAFPLPYNFMHINSDFT